MKVRWALGVAFLIPGMAFGQLTLAEYHHDLYIRMGNLSDQRTGYGEMDIAASVNGGIFSGGSRSNFTASSSAISGFNRIEMGSQGTISVHSYAYRRIRFNLNTLCDIDFFGTVPSGEMIHSQVVRLFDVSNSQTIFSQDQISGPFGYSGIHGPGVYEIVMGYSATRANFNGTLTSILPFNLVATPVPEPATLAGLGVGMVLLRRRRHA